MRPHFFYHPQEEAVRHLLRVACGLDSMILGEPQILGQLKQAYQVALRTGTLGKLLNRLFQHAFSVAKQVRTDTAIGSSPVSVAFAAVRLAQQIFGDLSPHTALLIGAGETIELTGQHLRNQGLQRIIIANRSVERAELLAARFDGYAIALKQIPQHLAEADIVIASTASLEPILGLAAAEQALKARRYRPMFIADLAVPRDVEAEVGKLSDVYLYTVDDLEAVIQENLHSRRLAALQADDIIAAQVDHFMDWLKSLNAVAAIQGIRARALAAQAEAYERARQRLANGEDPLVVLELFAHTLTNKLVHVPSVKLKEASAAGRGELLKAACELFDLPWPPPLPDSDQSR
jgi:glutamyl-tRNA reductase